MNRSAALRQRLADSKFASRADEIVEIANGKTPLRHGMSVEVERATKSAPNGQDYHVKIKASTETIARDSGIIPISAWEKGGLRNFSNNPIILAYHSHRDPIGISVYNELDANNLVEYWKFHEETDLSRTMKSLYEKGFMRAASVGFLVQDFVFVDELDDKELEALEKKYGKAALKDIYWIAAKAELLETSAVPVPSDPNALAFDFAARNAEAHGLDLSALHTFRSIDMKPGESAVATPPAKEEGARAEAPDLQKLVTDAVAKAFEPFEQRLATLEKREVPAPAVVEQVAAPAVEPEARKADEVDIEVRDGETPEQALARHVDERIAKLRGAPTPKTK